MQPPYNDRWERTRRHLLRNILVNPGFRLSPIPEDERSSPASDSSSLPDLVIEPAPDRHDHPPDFYVGLERRMKRYYRQLFLGENSDDDDSSDFEVNRSMASTFMLDNYTRKDTEANGVTEKNGTDSDLDHSLTEKRQLTKSTNEILENDISEYQDKYDDKQIDTCAAYNDTEHVSVNAKSSINEDENSMLVESRSINESNQSNKTDDDPNVNIEVYDYKQSYEDIDDNQGSTNGDKLNRSRAIYKSADASKFIENKSDSEEAPCHRVSTTVAEIHERRARDSTHVFDNDSPMLIPRLLQFSKSVFGSKRISGQRFNLSEASDEFIRRLSSHKSDVSSKRDEYIQEPETEVGRLLTTSDLTRASLESDKPVDTEKVVEYTEDKTQENDVSKNDDIEDEENSTLVESWSINESNQSNKTDDDPNVNIEVYGYKQSYEHIDDNQGSTNGDKLNRSRAIDKTADASKFIETKSDLEEAPCHRVSTTVAEIHERRARDSTHVFDNGSPVLPRLLQFSKSVFGSKRISGQRFNFSEASDEYIRRLSSHKSDVSSKRDEYIQEQETEVVRLLTASQLSRTSLVSDKPVDTNQVVEYTEDKTQEYNVNKTYDIVDKIQLSETQTDNEEDPSKLDTDEGNETEITGIHYTSIDWKDGIDDDDESFENPIRRVFTSKARKRVFSSSEESFDDLEPLAQSSTKSIDEVEVMREATGSGVNDSWDGEVDQGSPAALAFEKQTDADKLENESSDSTEINASFEEEIHTDQHNTNPQYVAKIIDEFWSVSPIEVDIDDSKEKSRGSKRRTDSEGDATKRQKRDVAIQTGLEGNKKWENIRAELFVGTPLVFRLCGCPDHVCS